MALRQRVEALRVPEPDGQAAVCKTSIPGSNPAAPLTEPTRIKPTGSDKTPSFTGLTHSSPKVHPKTYPVRIRPFPALPGTCATRGATRVCVVVHVPEDNPDLAAVVEAWPHLPEALKAGIVAMVKAASGKAE